MSSGTHSYVEVVPPGLPWPVLAPAARAEDAAWLEGAGALLAAALRSYNASVEALRGDDAVGALGHAERALAFMPYAPRLLDYAAVLALRHGDYELACRVLDTAVRLGLDDLVDAYRADLERRVVVWNEAVADPARLAARAAEENGELGYRERLLLQSLNGTREDAASGSRRPRGARWVAMAAVAVVALGAGALIGKGMGAGTGTPGAEEAAEASAAPEPEPAVSTLVTQALVALAGGDAATAAEHLAAAREEASETRHAAERLVAERLVAESRRAWRASRFEEVLERLRPLHSLEHVAPLEGLYYLGFAAERRGEDGIALRAFSRFLEADGSREQPHRRAQAAYSAARLAEPARAAHFARIVVDEFPDTIYDNSVVRDLAGHAVEG